MPLTPFEKMLQSGGKDFSFFNNDTADGSSEQSSIMVDPSSVMGRILKATGYKFSSTLEEPEAVDYSYLFGPDTILGRIKTLQDKMKAEEDAALAEYSKYSNFSEPQQQQTSKPSNLLGTQGSDITNRYSSNNVASMYLSDTPQNLGASNVQRQTLLGG